MTEDICPVCEVGKLEEHTYSDDFKHNGASIHVDGLECSICDHCGADPISPEQIKRNHKHIADTKRRAEGLLCSEEIVSARKAFGLTQTFTSQLFGGGLRAFSKYERGDNVQSVPMDRLLRLCIKYPYLIYDLAIMANEELPSDSSTSIKSRIGDYRDSGRVANDHYILGTTNESAEMTVVEFADYRSRAA